MKTKTPILDGAAFRMNQTPVDESSDEITASPAVAAVQPLKPELPDERVCPACKGNQFKLPAFAKVGEPCTALICSNCGYWLDTKPTNIEPTAQRVMLRQIDAGKEAK